jgi:hypothetical protein
VEDSQKGGNQNSQMEGVMAWKWELGFAYYGVLSDFVIMGGFGLNGLHGWNVYMKERSD